MYVGRRRYISFGAFTPNAVHELIQTQAPLYPTLTQREWHCIQAHLLSCYTCLMTNTSLPVLAYQNLVERDATYHAVHLNSLLPYEHKLPPKSIVLANRFYRYRGNYYISARLSLAEA